MTPFKDRAARLDLSFPLRFSSEDGTVAGHCLNLSESGLLANFDHPLELWTRGELLLHFATNQCQVDARVARVNEREAGLSFLYKSDGERHAIHTLLAFAERQSQLTGRPPF